jgi:hypothetical protein
MGDTGDMKNQRIARILSILFVLYLFMWMPLVRTNQHIRERMEVVHERCYVDNPRRPPDYVFSTCGCMAVFHIWPPELDPDPDWTIFSWIHD